MNVSSLSPLSVSVWIRPQHHGRRRLKVDRFVLTRQHLRTGQIVECEPIGLMEQLEDGKEDHNVLAVMPDERKSLDIETINALTEFVRHVFDRIPCKANNAEGFLDPRAAIDYVSRRQDST
jgi:hypothetical protein